MTNVEILQAEVTVRGIEEDVHTFQMWKKLGYSIKKGEKALFETKLWKKSNKTEVVIDEETGEKEERLSGRFYLAKSFLFGRHQVEEIKR